MSQNVFKGKQIDRQLIYAFICMIQDFMNRSLILATATETYQLKERGQVPLRKDSAMLLHIHTGNISLIISQRIYGYLLGQLHTEEKGNRPLDDYLGMGTEMICTHDLTHDLKHYYGSPVQTENIRRQVINGIQV